MAIRIQLASNFQVIELTYDCWDDLDDIELEEATNLVNKLGKEVTNDIKKPQESKKEELATPGQIKYLIGLGITEKEAKKMTKKEAWTTIQELKVKEED